MYIGRRLRYSEVVPIFATEADSLSGGINSFLGHGVSGRMVPAPHYTTIHFRMLHILICNTDIVPVIFCECDIWFSYVKRRTQIEGLGEQVGEENI
jgi:hypothetical protein